MKFREVGDVVLRPQTSPLISLLSTSARSSTRRNIISSRRVFPFVCQSCQQSSSSNAFRQQAAAKAPPPKSSWESTPPSNVSPSASKQRPLDQNDRDFIDKAMDFSRTPGASAKHTQHHKKPGPQRLQYSSEQLSGSSVDDAMSAYDTRPGWTSPRQKPRQPSKPLDSLLFPKAQSGFELSDLSSPENTAVSQPRVLHELNIHLSARTGRTLGVDPNNQTELGLRLRQLDMLVGRNKIRGDHARQKFHERGGLKRKRLASERWRKRFRAGFQRAVTRVQDLRRKGW